MSKILYILFLILIIDNFNFVYTENKYKINIIDSDLKTAYFSSILLDKNGFYYIVTGENYDLIIIKIQNHLEDVFLNLILKLTY